MDFVEAKQFIVEDDLGLLRDSDLQIIRFIAESANSPHVQESLSMLSIPSEDNQGFSLDFEYTAFDGGTGRKYGNYLDSHSAMVLLLDSKPTGLVSFCQRSSIKANSVLKFTNG